MDPTAPNDPNNPSNPNDPKTPPSPIQPGQFVTAGQDDGVFGQPPPPITPQVQLAGQLPQSPLAQGSPDSAVPPSPQTQPSPEPYIPPDQPGQGSAQETSIIGKLRGLLIVFGLLLLLGLVAAAVWFLVLDKSQTPQTSSAADQVQIEAPPTPQSNTSGGFSNLPPATEEAQPESTPSSE